MQLQQCGLLFRNNVVFNATDQFILCFVYYFLMGAIPYSVAGYENSGTLMSWMYTGGLIVGSLARFICSFPKLLFFHLIPMTIVQVQILYMKLFFDLSRAQLICDWYFARCCCSVI